MTEDRYLRLLQLLYQGFRLITAGLKKEIDAIKDSLSKDNSL